MGNNSTNTDIQVGDWIINTLCNLQPDLISLIKQQEQKSVNTDRLYDSLKGDIQASFTRPLAKVAEGLTITHTSITG